jgi:hypothetical protein
VDVLLFSEREFLPLPEPGDKDVADHARKADYEAADRGDERESVHAFGS